MQIKPGNTKIESYALEGEEIYFKREDLNPSGSFKDRLIFHIWGELMARAEKEIVMSSSGNFAISLLFYLTNHPDKLNKRVKIFIKNNLPEEKLQKLENLAQKAGADLIYSPERPKSDAIKYARDNDAYFLRGSTGEGFHKAYYGLAKEIVEYEQKNSIEFENVYICCSSGTATAGLTERLIELGRDLRVVIVQTSHIYSIAREFDHDFEPEDETKANAISDRVAKRKGQVLELLAQNQGAGVVVENAEIEAARDQLNAIVHDKGMVESFTGNAALSLTGLFKYKRISLSKKMSYNAGKQLVIISGN